MAFLPPARLGCNESKQAQAPCWGSGGGALKLCGWLLLVHTMSLNPQVVECQSREGAYNPPPPPPAASVLTSCAWAPQLALLRQHGDAAEVGGGRTGRSLQLFRS